MKSYFFVMIHFLILLICLFFIYCEDGEELKKKKNDEALKLTVLLADYRMQGNCVKTVTSGSTLSKTCSRYPRGFCSVNFFIRSKEEAASFLNAGRKLIERTSECQESLVLSGVLTTKQTTADEENSIRANYGLEVFSSCEDAGAVIPNTKLLASYEDLLFLDSARGKVAKSAWTISKNIFLTTSSRNNANTCLDKEFNSSEKDLAKKVVETSVTSEIGL